MLSFSWDSSEHSIHDTQLLTLCQFNKTNCLRELKVDADAVEYTMANLPSAGKYRIHLIAQSGKEKSFESEPINVEISMF